jgi:hypothetical protein
MRRSYAPLPLVACMALAGQLCFLWNTLQCWLQELMDFNSHIWFLYKWNAVVISELEVFVLTTDLWRNLYVTLLINLEAPPSLWRSHGFPVTHDCSLTPRSGRHYSRTLIWRQSSQEDGGSLQENASHRTTIPQKLARPCNRSGVGTSGRKAEGCLVGCGEAVSRRLAGESLSPIPLWWFRA